MLKIIKSSYLIKKLFLYVNEKQKLKFVKYNKALQKIIHISINNYIHFQGKFIIYDSFKKGKEYNYEEILLFEGEYLNGKRNGKGKEYDYDGKLRFEGEYLYGFRLKGMTFHTKLIFDGEYLYNKE